jgi:long-chain acyl-CoA synthetase
MSVVDPQSSSQNLALLVDAVCARQAARPALFYGGGAISYGELAALVEDWAAALRERGAGPDRAVAIWLPNSPAFVAGFLATLRLGGVAAPLGVLLTGREIEHRLAIARAAVLITTSALARQLGDVGAVVLAVDAGDLRGPGGSRAAATARSPVVARADDDVAVLISTSGTTGKPKAAELTHRGLTWNAAAMVHGLALGPEDVQLGVAPLSHVLGMTGVMNASLISGGAFALTERFDPAAAVALLAQTGTTGVLGAPPMFAALVREARRAGLTHRLRFAMAGGAPLPTSVTRAVEETFGCALSSGYGMSEVGGGITQTPIDVSPKPGSVGPALPGSELRILDLGTGEALGVDVAGEVAVRSPSVMRRYRDDDEATRAALSADGWLLTGDIGHLDAEGHLFLVDRKKELIIRSGYNVYPREVEDVLQSYPGVADAAVVGVPDEEHGEEIAALVVPAPGHTLDPEAVKTFAKERLAAYKYPRRIVVVTDLPRSPTGKILKSRIDRQALVPNADGGAPPPK